MALYASAEENKVMLDVRELGVKFIGTSAQPEDYYGPGVVNMRCAYSVWDKNQEYLWLVSDWSRSPKEPASLYLGEYDMSKIKKIEFDYVTNSASSMEAFVSFTKDAEGTQKVASATVTEVTGGLANPKHKEMEILDAGYMQATQDPCICISTMILECLSATSFSQWKKLKNLHIQKNLRILRHLTQMPHCLFLQ